MLVRLIAVGKIREPYVAAACADFTKRLAPYLSLETLEVKASPGADRQAAVKAESRRVASLLRPGEDLWLLERTGTQLSSEALAQRLTSLSDEGKRALAIVVGGTFGVDESLRARAHFLWSLSQLTFLHEWARMVALEQLYRAMKITRGEPYHH